MSHNYWQLTLAIATTLTCGAILAQERARVLSAVPVVQQVGVPQQFCEDVQIYSGPRHRNEGPVVGAIVGDARENDNAYTELRGRAQEQRRGGNSAAEVVAGGYLGNVMEDSRRQPRFDTAHRCTNETVYKNRTVGYDVTYEYAGQRHTTRMDHNPGSWVPVQVPTPGHYSSAGNRNGQAVTPGRSYQSTPQGSAVTESITYSQPSVPIVIGVDVEGGRPSRPPHGHRPPPPPPPHWR